MKTKTKLKTKLVTYKGIIIDDTFLECAYIGFGMRRDLAAETMDNIFHAVSGTTHGSKTDLPVIGIPADQEPSNLVPISTKTPTGRPPQSKAQRLAKSKRMKAYWRKKRSKANAA